MTDESDPPDRTATEEAFALISNEIRAAILGVLGETPHEALSFSELRERVGGDVDSGQFNYHLQQLVGQFVEHTDDGYEMSPRGRALYRAVRSGALTESATVEPFDAGIDCHFCGTAVEASYEEGSFDVRCPGCGHVYSHTAVPPGNVEDVDPETLLTRVDQYNRHEMLAYARGVCPVCVNGLDASFVRGEDVWSEGAERFDVFVSHECDHCGKSHYMTVGVALLYHPALVSFFHRRGVDVTSVPVWELPFAMTDRDVTVRSTDPWEVALRVTRDGDALELVVDQSLNVTVVVEP
jgi:DNA-binding HxlR family transcriptional regulator/rubredoxin